MSLQTILQNITPQLELLLRIIIACVCGFFIGYERSVRQKDAGIRTHVVVALGSALMMVVSKYGYTGILGIEGVDWDASRIASCIISGIGFLGAGVIFVKKSSVRGLTTAAVVWTTAGIGITIGAGMYFLGISATILMILLQFILHNVIKGLDNVSNNDIVIKMKNKNKSYDSLKEYFAKNSIIIVDCKYQKDDNSETITFMMTLKIPNKFDTKQLIDYGIKSDDILSINIEDINS